LPGSVNLRRFYAGALLRDSRKSPKQPNAKGAKEAQRTQKNRDAFILDFLSCPRQPKRARNSRTQRTQRKRKERKKTGTHLFWTFFRDLCGSFASFAFGCPAARLPGFQLARQIFSMLVPPGAP